MKKTMEYYRWSALQYTQITYLTAPVERVRSLQIEGTRRKKMENTYWVYSCHTYTQNISCMSGTLDRGLGRQEQKEEEKKKN